MEKLTVVGVPEHFNLPWHMAIAEGAFKERGIDLQWTDVPEGTGRMCQLLREQKTDLAIVLTEGIVKDIHGGNSSKIIQEYIATPLQWGIHVAAQSSYHTFSDLEHTKAAISRYGSGSHLMAYVNAQNLGWDISKLQFEITHNLQGAAEALTSAQADYFIWEHFTTKPLVDQGVFRRLGDCPTPWPCFVIAASETCLQYNTGLLRHVIEVINRYTSEFRHIPSIDRTLANQYEQQLEDIREWLSITQWSQNQIQIQVLDKVQDTLAYLKLISKKINSSELLTTV